MKLSVKIIFALLFFCAVIVSPVTAFPGIQSYLPDASGQYVYYRDYSFDFEAYVGFLHYDEATYAMRFFAPNYPVENAPLRAGSGRTGIPKSIEVLFTVNPKVDYTEMTGERFLSVIEGSDTDIVNYMHDLVYEFSARRRNLEQTPLKETLQIQDDFAQFGGMIVMEYSFDVPIFNLKQIKSGDGNVIFQLVTAGSLVSSEDKSFSNFTGFPAPMKDKQRSFVSSKKKGDTEIKYNAQQIKLDNQWTQAADNMFLLGDVAVLVMSDFPSSSTNGTTKELLDSFCRIFSLGTQDSYSVWTSRKVKQKNDSLSVEILYYLPSENSVSRDFKVIKKNNDNSFSVLSLTVFDNTYKTNKEYFENILKSYK